MYIVLIHSLLLGYLIFIATAHKQSLSKSSLNSDSFLFKSSNSLYFLRFLIYTSNSLDLLSLLLLSTVIHFFTPVFINV